MTIFTFSEHSKYRQEMMRDIVVGQLVHGRRGDYGVFPSYTIENPVNAKLEDTISPQLREILEGEFRLCWNGLDLEPALRNKLYHNDDEAYEHYKALNLHHLSKHPDSRNNIICDTFCCMAYWQLYQDVLTVISRSMDMQRAGLSDCLLTNRVAGRLNARIWRIHNLIPHIYTDRQTIARRPQ